MMNLFWLKEMADGVHPILVRKAMPTDSRKRKTRQEWTPTPRGVRLRAARVRAGYKSCEEAVASLAAKGVEVNIQSYFQYESGRRNPDPELVKILADHYGVSTDHLLYGETKAVRVVVRGYVETGGRVVLTDDETETVEAPPVEEPWNLIPYRVKGRSLYPRYEAGDRIFYDEQIFRTKPNHISLKGRDCVVEDTEGDLYVVTVLRILKNGEAVVRCPSGKNQRHLTIAHGAPIQWVKKA